MEISEILEAFRIYDGRYKREHVSAAMEMREEITPHLIGILETLFSDPTPYLDDDSDLFDHMYAVMLLGYFREARAHDIIVEVFSMPDRIPSDLFGDIVTENLPVILYKTCNGSLDRIRELVLNHDAYDFCRSSALEAMAYAMFDGVLSRDELLDFFGSLFTGNEAEPDSSFWASLTSLICSLHPEELMPVIKKAFEDDLIELFFIDEEDVEMALRGSKEAALEKVKKDFEGRMSEDVHSQMSWWATFEEPVSEKPVSEKPVSVIPPPISQGKKKPKKKKRKKMAKASRRRNRRKR